MVRRTRAGLRAAPAPGHGPLNQRHGRRLAKRNQSAGATAATSVRDPRDWTRATSLPAADGDRTLTEFPIAEYLQPSFRLTAAFETLRLSSSGHLRFCG
jgi:hypothetical protein